MFILDFHWLRTADYYSMHTQMTSYDGVTCFSKNFSRVFTPHTMHVIPNILVYSSLFPLHPYHIFASLLASIFFSSFQSVVISSPFLSLFRDFLSFQHFLFFSFSSSFSPFAIFFLLLSPPPPFQPNSFFLFFLPSFPCCLSQ